VVSSSSSTSGLVCVWLFGKIDCHGARRCHKSPLRPTHSTRQRPCRSCPVFTLYGWLKHAFVTVSHHSHNSYPNSTLTPPHTHTNEAVVLSDPLPITQQHTRPPPLSPPPLAPALSPSTTPRSLSCLILPPSPNNSHALPCPPLPPPPPLLAPAPQPALVPQTKYYTDKLELPDASSRWTSVVVGHYIRGLHWVLQYYYRGVASWDWFYPYHYAPMAQDMRQLGDIDGETLAGGGGDCWALRVFCCWAGGFLLAVINGLRTGGVKVAAGLWQMTVQGGVLGVFRANARPLASRR